ncbi:MAG: regulatory iron-sulfur-containing complex subunit RicT [Coriobacteriia bacterium]|nr:regulatory iron-sulfur-containing complex subunit RicT [Coriobacteriia bacterium]
MTRIAPVNLPYNPKTLWFDARDLELAEGDHVVVLTARGLEYGRLSGSVFQASPEQLSRLKSSLKPVKRKATEEDDQHAAEMERLSREALPLFKEMAAESEVDMRPVSVEYLFDGDKAIFYFEAEDRVDFRELVRKLAAELHVRIDMRQIGVRDEARMVGGIGHCGQQLCCARLGGEFCPVSIRMAKEQDLSLNPQKISGVCGRLMCCLRYEYDAYKDFKSRAPKQNGTVQTPAGPAKVVDLDMPREIVSLRVTVNDKPKVVKVPLADFDPPQEEGTRPKTVGEEAWQRATEPEESKLNFDISFMTSQFTGSDKLGAAKAVRRNNANVKNATGSMSMDGTPASGRKRRSRGGRGQQAAAASATPPEHKQRRRRSTRISAEGSMAEAVVDESLAAKHRKPMEFANGEAGAKDAAKPKKESSSSRRRRRRRRGGGGSGAEGANAAAASPNAEAKGGRSRSCQQAERKDAKAARPGQRSSGLRNGAGSGAAAGNAAGKQEGAPKEGSSSGRRRRRRRGGSGKPGSGAGANGGGQVKPNAD